MEIKMNDKEYKSEKWGLCLAGGGGKGAYEIGILKALEECMPIKFQMVSGASVGASPTIASSRFLTSFLRIV